MKRIFTLLIIVLTVGSFQAYAQDDIDALLEGGVADGEKLIGAYITPMMNSLSLGMNQGWYNTAKPHKLAGFDLTATVSLMYIPDSDLLFDAGGLQLTSLVQVNSSGNQINFGDVPTIFGSDTPSTFSPSSTVSGPLATTVDDFEITGIDLKSEIKRNALPVPMAQFGFGLPKGTELKFRLIPKVDLGNDSQFNMFGIGVMHDVKQYIPGLKNLPFDLSALVGYTKMKLDITQSNPDQKGLFEVNSTTIQGVVSKKLSVVTFYGGLGYNIAKSRLTLLGTYDTGLTTTTDPIDLSFAASGMRLTTGIRLKLAVFAFSADYTIQKYKALTVGFGINVR
ncbi:MAG TPA: DUF6588 family protein [Cyclobacteriaceae bacterium]